MGQARPPVEHRQRRQHPMGEIEVVQQLLRYMLWGCVGITLVPLCLLLFQGNEAEAQYRSGQQPSVEINLDVLQPYYQASGRKPRGGRATAVVEARLDTRPLPAPATKPQAPATPLLTKAEEKPAPKRDTEPLIEDNTSIIAAVPTRTAQESGNIPPAAKKTQAPPPPALPQDAIDAVSRPAPPPPPAPALPEADPDLAVIPPLPDMDGLDTADDMDALPDLPPLPDMPAGDDNAKDGTAGDAETADETDALESEEVLEETDGSESEVETAPEMASADTPRNTAQDGKAPSMTLSFSPEETSLTMSAENQLDEVVDILQADPEKRIQLEAYAQAADNQSSSARRIALSRAFSVRTYLIENGIEAIRITVKAYGDVQRSDNPDRVELFY